MKILAQASLLVAILTPAALIELVASPPTDVFEEYSSQQAVEFISAAPETVGLKKADVLAVLAGIKELIEDQEAVGAEVLIMKNGKIVLHEAVGWRDREVALPMELNTICCVRSMSKPIVGTALMMLIEEGKIGLTDRASKYLPSFDNPKSREMTIVQLLTHTAGFPLTRMDKDHTTYSGQRAVADQAGELGPTGKPGEFSYSDSDTETLAAIVAEVSKQPIEEFFRKRILEPLGMKDTYCVLGKDAPQRSRVSSNYAGSTAYWHKYWDRNDSPFFPYFLGAAAMYSTPIDYARFLKLWLDHGKVGSKQLLSEATIDRALKPAAAMLTPGSTQPYPTSFSGLRPFYGHHWMIYKSDKPNAASSLPVFGHGGSDGTLAIAFPEQDLMAFYFTQSRGGMSVFQFEALISPLVGLPAPAKRQRIPVDKLTPYAGQYRPNIGGTLAYVFTQGNRLVVDFPGQGVVVPQWPDADGRWSAGPAAPNLAFRFDAGANGEINRLHVLQGKIDSVLERIVPAKDLPTADELMADMRRKQGGDSIDALKTLQLKGKIVAGKAEFEVEFLADGGAKLLRRVKSASGEELLILNEGRGWQQPAGKPAIELTGLFREQFLRINPLARVADWRKHTKSLAIVRKEKVGDEDTWVVRLAGEDLPPSTRYVSCKSGLVLKESTWIVVKGVGLAPFTVRYEDYRDVGGVLLPFRMLSESRFTGQQTVQLSEGKANPKIPDGTFDVKSARK